MDLRADSVIAFERELIIYVSVQHPHIVSFYGAIAGDDQLRICLEYCGGGSLFDLLYGNNRTQKISWRQRLVMLYDIANAVAYLHGFEPALVHRDLKSLNVLLREPFISEHVQPHVKLCDFGFSRMVGDCMTTGAGTSHWMAPEVISGTEYTETADSFSFAMTIYEVLSRSVPFEKEAQAAVAKTILSGVRPGLTMRTSRGEVAELPPGLVKLMESCWDQDPNMRPNFTKVCEDLIQIARHTPDHLKLATPGQLSGEMYSI